MTPSVNYEAMTTSLEHLRALASTLALPPSDPGFASHLDSQDPLSSFRNDFHLPPHPASSPPLDIHTQPHTHTVHTQPSSIYLCGNSLGLMPRATATALQGHLDAWATRGVEGHFTGDNPWMPIEDGVSRMMMEIVGARFEHEVVVMNSLTVNLHLFMTAFYRPNSNQEQENKHDVDVDEGKMRMRSKILLESHAFPSDEYAIQSQVLYHGGDIQRDIIRVAPLQETDCLTTHQILDEIEENKDTLALILLPGVQYYTGQVFPIKEIVEKAHSYGIPVGLDLAHAVGNIELALHDWQVDFAVWCSYKYLNSGPGALAGAFLHHRHAHRPVTDLHRFSGWWGHDRQSRFQMDVSKPFQPQPGARGFQLSNPPVFALAPMEASLRIFERATMRELRSKSKLLTAYLELLVTDVIGASGQNGVKIITPKDENQRGCQLSFLFARKNVKQVHSVISSRGVICDTREPDVMRIAPVPLYNSFEEVRRFVLLLHDAILEAAK